MRCDFRTTRQRAFREKVRRTRYALAGRPGYDFRMTDTERIRDACLTASAELGVRIVTPFSLMGGQGTPVEFIALFPDFGGLKGTVVCDFAIGGRSDWSLR